MINKCVVDVLIPHQLTEEEGGGVLLFVLAKSFYLVV